MRLVKVEDGLLEYVNHFLDAPIGDFLGEFLFSRSGDTFNLKSGYIERVFPYNEYVIVVEKEPVILDEGDAYGFYAREGGKIAGLLESREDGETPATHWKLIRHKGFIQGYRSNDGVTWENKGGGEISALTETQGFSIQGNKELKLRDYKVYRSPYVRFYNFEQGTVAHLYDEKGEKVTERVSNEDELIEIYLENPIFGSVRFYNKDGVFVMETPLMNLKYGDTFFNFPHDIEFYYKGSVLDYSPKKLNTRHEVVEMKNLSTTETYELLKLTIVHDTVDRIKISLDDRNFYNELIVPNIAPQQKIPIYIKIDKNPNHPSYGIRKFALEVDDGKGFLGGSGAIPTREY